MTLDRLSHFVGAVKAQTHQPLHRRLGEGDDAPAGQVLAQQHTEHRRLRRVFHCRFGQMDARMVAGCGEKQAAAQAGAAQAEDQRVALGLLDAVNAAAEKLVCQLARHCGEK